MARYNKLVPNPMREHLRQLLTQVRQDSFRAKLRGDTSKHKSLHLVERSLSRKLFVTAPFVDKFGRLVWIKGHFGR